MVWQWSEEVSDGGGGDGSEGVMGRREWLGELGDIWEMWEAGGYRSASAPSYNHPLVSSNVLLLDQKVYNITNKKVNFWQTAHIQIKISPKKNQEKCQHLARNVFFVFRKWPFSGSLSWFFSKQHFAEGCVFCNAFSVARLLIWDISRTSRREDQ